MSKKKASPPPDPTLPEEHPITMEVGTSTWLVMKGGVHNQTPVVKSVRTLPPRKAIYMLKEGSGYVRLYPEDIVYIQAKGNYVEVYRPRSRIVLHHSLSDVLKSLPVGVMARINRSQAVNIRRIEHIGTDEVVVSELVFTLSNQYREELLRHVKIITDR